MASLVHHLGISAQSARQAARVSSAPAIETSKAPADLNRLDTDAAAEEYLLGPFIGYGLVAGGSTPVPNFNKTASRSCSKRPMFPRARSLSSPQLRIG
jgi:hypothetical protein